MTVTRSSKFLVFLMILLALGFATIYLLPLGMPDSSSYFEPVGSRQLQDDELGQLISVEETFFSLSLHGDEFNGWNTDHQDFWKYSIAFAAYGIPSLIMIDPDNRTRYQALMDTMIWKMKSKRVWSDFTERGFGSDPITVQNIMYKGHLNLMYGLYQLATNDTRYELEYTWLTKQLVEEMRIHHRGEYEGVTCEPGAWFVECNAIGMMSLLVYDHLYGTRYTENEVQWSIEFIERRMSDPETGLFYRAYLPNHDLVKKQLSGYANAWILSFLNPFLGDEFKSVYPSFKDTFVEQFGPYAAVKERESGDPDQVAQIFAMWAAKEHKDVELFNKLRNSIDKFGGLGADPQNDGLAYDDPNSVLINGVILASKVHLGWEAIFEYAWPSLDKTRDIPNVDGITWSQILPQHVFSSKDGALDVVPSAPLSRACPACYWGRYQSIRMEHDQNTNRCSTSDLGRSNSRCDVGLVRPKDVENE
ncbi:hypothetical protein NBRC116583_10960 [Arenicella sp. 4NH20-0111]|uniref:linalool dehydratase/isomerase domain-containing protein n=1 Tax=Arenicella sp. 4NH20-0111 TaxID=3127648 RepID=UPI00310BCA08